MRWVSCAISFAVSFAIASGIAAPVSAQAVSENFDRITGERTISYTADGSMDSARPVFTFDASFAGEASSSAISLAFVSADEGAGMPAARFAGCHDIEWRVDGRSVAAAPASHRGRAVDGEMIELIEQAVTVEWASAVANGQDVRYRVCRNEYALSSRDIEAFGRIAAKLKSATLASSAARAGKPAEAPTAEVEYKGMNWRPKNPGSF